MSALSASPVLFCCHGSLQYSMGPSPLERYSKVPSLADTGLPWRPSCTATALTGSYPLLGLPSAALGKAQLYTYGAGPFPSVC